MRVKNMMDAEKLLVRNFKGTNFYSQINHIEHFLASTLPIG